MRLGFIRVLRQEIVSTYSRSGKQLLDQPDVLAFDISEFAKTDEQSCHRCEARLSIDMSNLRNPSLLGLRGRLPSGSPNEGANKVAAFHFSFRRYAYAEYLRK